MALSIDFAGRHVFVFGGTTGINFGVAEAFAKHGANLTVVSRKQENVDNAVAALRLHGGDPVGATGDVRDMEAVDRALQAGCARHGAIDVLVSAVNDLSSNGFRAVVDIDLIGTFHVMRATFPRLTKPGASVINITAPQSFVPMRYQAHVCADARMVSGLAR